MPVEVKSGWVSQSKSLKVYADRYQPQRAYVLSANNVTHSNTRYYLPLYTAGRLLMEDYTAGSGL